MLFWNNWPRPYKQLIWTIIILALACALWFVYYYIIGNESIIGWDILAKTEKIQVLIDSFTVGPFHLSTSAENSLFFQHYSGSLPELNAASYYILLCVTVLCINILLSVVTFLPRFWYFAGIAIFAFVLVNYKFELLLLFGSEEKWGLIFALILFLPTSYFFNIKPEIGFLKRLLTFALITATLGVIIARFSQVDTPFLYLATYGIINPLVISLIFVLMVAHEIIAAFIYLLTSSGNSSGGKNTLVHFYVITTIYLINLLLAYLHESHVIAWDIVYVNLFLLLFISAILGFWGFARRREQYNFLFDFYPLGALTYLALAICCFVTLGHFQATFNDPAMEVFKDFIIYGHLGFGVIFVVYITSNFLDPLRRNMQVHKVLYKPTSMPYFTFRLAGLIAFIAFVMKSNWEVPVNQSTSAYFNGIADLHYQNHEFGLAETYYKEGAVFGYKNHKSHYMLGKLADNKNDDVKAAVYYQSAIEKSSTPQSHVNLSNIYMNQSRLFDALFTLDEGLERHPESAEILNNLGVAYAKTSILDTAAYYLHRAVEATEAKSAAASNIVALLAKHDLKLQADSLLQNLEIEEDPIYLNNSFVLKNRAGEYLDKDYVPEDSILSFLEASILYNRAFNGLFSNDSIDVSQLKKFGKVKENLNFRENLTLAACLNLYENSNINEAFRQLNWLANSSTFNSGAYFNLVGLWAMEQDAPDIAADYFNWAAERNWSEAPLNLAIALTESRNLTQAINEWNKLLKTDDVNAQTIAKDLLTILNATKSDFSTFSDRQKYLYTRYRIDWQDTIPFNSLVTTIKDNNYLGHSLLNMSMKLWKKDLVTPAIGYYGKLSGLQITDENLFQEIQWYELTLLAAQRNIRGLSTKVNQGIRFDEDHVLEKKFFTALINEASGDTATAKKNYRFIAYKNPFLEEATIAAATFLGQFDKFEGYDILLSAIEINPNSVKLLKAYILQAARVQLDNYAQHGLKDLKPLISADAFRKFLRQYQLLVNQVTKAEDTFRN